MNIVVNGGSGGIGREVVILMASDKNNKILVTARNEGRLKSLASECPNKNVSFHKIDISALDNDIESLKDQVCNLFKKIDILINIAGFLTVKDFISISNEDARKMMETNFFGPAGLIRLCVPLMPPGSHIINISSMGGYQGSAKYPGMSYYSASKAALACLTECIAVEFKNLNISVNCLALGSVQTEMLETAFPGFKAPVNAREMAEFISYFAINGGRFFNGKILPVAVGNP